MSSNNATRNSESISNPQVAQAAPVQEPSTGGIPDWASVVHPRELAFYRLHIDSLNRINQGISAIARTLIQAHWHDESHDEDDARPGWFNGNIRYGLLNAIEALTDGGARSIEFMQERADQYAPSESRND